MLHSAIKGISAIEISANGSIELSQTVHYWISFQKHHQNGCPRCEESQERNCKLRYAFLPKKSIALENKLQDRLSSILMC